MHVWLSSGSWNGAILLCDAGGPNVILKVLISERVSFSVMQPRRDSTSLFCLWRWKGATSQGLQAASWSWKRLENRFSVRASRKEHSLADTLILAQWDLFQTSDLQNYKTIHLCCVKPLNLWPCVTAATGTHKAINSSSSLACRVNCCPHYPIYLKATSGGCGLTE